MNRNTRTALELLQKHGEADLWNDNTSIDGRGKKATLRVNWTTARALVRRGLAEITDDGDGKFLKITEAGTAHQL